MLVLSKGEYTILMEAALGLHPCGIFKVDMIDRYFTFPRCSELQAVLSNIHYLKPEMDLAGGSIDVAVDLLGRVVCEDTVS